MSNNPNPDKRSWWSRRFEDFASVFLDKEHNDLIEESKRLLREENEQKKRRLDEAAAAKKKQAQEQAAAEEKAAKAAEREAAKAEKAAEREAAKKQAAEEKRAREAEREAAKKQAAEEKRAREAEKKQAAEEKAAAKEQEKAEREAAKRAEAKANRDHEIKLLDMKQKFELEKLQLQQQAKEREQAARQKTKEREQAIKQKQTAAKEQERINLERFEQYVVDHSENLGKKSVKLKITQDVKPQPQQQEYLTLRILNHYFTNQKPKFTAADLPDSAPDPAFPAELQKAKFNFKIEVDRRDASITITSMDNKANLIIHTNLLSAFVVKTEILYSSYALQFIDPQFLIAGHYAYDIDQKTLLSVHYESEIAQKQFISLPSHQKVRPSNYEPACLSPRFSLNNFFYQCQRQSNVPFSISEDIHTAVQSFLKDFEYEDFEAGLDQKFIQFLEHGFKNFYINNVLLFQAHAIGATFEGFMGYFPFELQTSVPQPEAMLFSSLFCTNVTVAEINYKPLSSGLYAALTIDGLFKEKERYINMAFLYDKVREWIETQQSVVGVPGNKYKRCNDQEKNWIGKIKMAEDEDKALCTVIELSGMPMYADAVVRKINRRDSTAEVSFSTKEDSQSVKVLFKNMHLPYSYDYEEVMALCYWKGYNCILLNCDLRKHEMYTLGSEDQDRRVAIIGLYEEDYYVIGRDFTQEWNPIDKKGTWSLEDLKNDCTSKITAAADDDDDDDATFNETCRVWAKKNNITIKAEYTWPVLAKQFFQR